MIAFNALFGAIGVSLGALIRNLMGAVTAALARILLVETTVANLVKSVARWLPNRSGLALDYLPSHGSPLPQWTAALILAGYALVFAAIAVGTTVRRDVT